MWAWNKIAAIGVMVTIVGSCSYIEGCNSSRPARAELKQEQDSRHYMAITLSSGKKVPMVSTNGIAGPYIPLDTALQAEAYADERFLGQRQTERANLRARLSK